MKEGIDGMEGEPVENRRNFRMNRVNEEHVVVCVDDEPAILASLVRLLRNEPYQVLTTDRPDRVLAWVRTRDVSLVISDQRMPEMEGTQLLEEVWKRSPTTARVILTAYPGPTSATPRLKTRIEVMISKPWDGPMLKRTIRQLLHDREWEEQSERVAEQA